LLIVTLAQQDIGTEANAPPAESVNSDQYRTGSLYSGIGTVSASAFFSIPVPD
jgi:hypothetical protein